MRFLLAPDSFKGSLTSTQVATIMQDAILAVDADANVAIFPLADGGEGSIETIQATSGGDRISTRTMDPLGRPMDSHYLRQGPRAIIELAAASGLTLLGGEDRNPAITTTQGTGMQVRHAIESGARHIVLCIGGSATNDAGAGIAHELGVQFLNENGHPFVPTGGTLHQVADIVFPSLDPALTLTVLCDVTNPFLGADGAVQTYAPQKGATTDQLEKLEKGMKHLADLLHDLDRPSIHQMKGAGAAGGVGGGMHAMLGAELQSGIEFIADHLGLTNAIAKSDLVITGEGRLDAQTGHGKAIRGIVNLAASHGVPVIAICGAIDASPDQVSALGLRAAFSIQRSSQPLEVALASAASDLTFTMRQVASVLIHHNG